MNKYRKIFSVIPTHLILIFFAIVALIPIWIIFISSIKPHVEVYKNQIALPNKMQLQFYHIFITQGYYKNYLQSFYFASLTTIISVIISILAAYAFAIKVFFGNLENPGLFLLKGFEIFFSVTNFCFFWLFYWLIFNS